MRESVERGVVSSPGIGELGAQTARALEEEARRSGGATPRRKKNRKSTYRLQKKHRK